MKIKHSDLRRIFNMLMDSIPENLGDEIELLYDYYWNVSVGTRHIVENEPELDMGSLDHDLERLQQSLQNNDPMYSDFRYLGNILIAIEDTVAPSRVYELMNHK